MFLPCVWHCSKYCFCATLFIFGYISSALGNLCLYVSVSVCAPGSVCVCVCVSVTMCASVCDHVWFSANIWLCTCVCVGRWVRSLWLQFAQLGYQKISKVLLSVVRHYFTINNWTLTFMPLLEGIAFIKQVRNNDAKCLIYNN